MQLNAAKYKISYLGDQPNVGLSICNDCGVCRHFIVSLPKSIDVLKGYADSDNKTEHRQCCVQIVLQIIKQRANVHHAE